MAETPPDAHAVLRDWLTIWLSELQALAVDREWREWGWTRPGWAGDPHGRPGAAAPPGPAAAADAPGASGAAELDGLRNRIGQLERRLAELPPRD